MKSFSLILGLIIGVATGLRSIAPARAQTLSVVETHRVHGQVVDEAGKPVPNAVWRIGGTEVLQDGKWTRVINLGDVLDSTADAEGRFVISIEASKRLDLQSSLR